MQRREQGFVLRFTGVLATANGFMSLEFRMSIRPSRTASEMVLVPVATSRKVPVANYREGHTVGLLNTAHEEALL
eukprot:scaffold7468_cov31-Prasinocladus_malaysianus.AAC.1